MAIGCSGNDKEVEAGSVGSAPTVFIDTPSDGEMLPPDVAFAVGALINDDSTAGTELTIVIESSVGGEVAHEGSIDESGSFSADIALPSGAQTLTVSATDEEGLTGSDSVDLQINGPPTAPVVGTEPVTPGVAEAILGVILEESIDPDDDDVEYRWTWTVQANPDATAVPYSPPGEPDKVPSGLTERGQVWTATATPRDELGNEGPSGSVSILVGNGAPSVDRALLEPDPAYTSDSLTVIVEGWSDPDDDPENYIFEWSINGEIVEDLDAPDLPSSLHAKGDSVEVSVTPFDGYASGEPLVAGPLVIQNTPPSALAVSIMPVAPITTDDLMAVPLGWADADGDTEQYLYRWFVDGVEVFGETSALFPGDLTEHYQEIVVEITPFDGEDEGDPVTSAGVVVGNTAPEILAVTLSPIMPNTIDAVTPTASGWSDLDGDEPDYLYSWTVNGVAAPTTSATLSPSLTQRGDELQATVTPVDGSDSGIPVSSDTVTVVNSPPSVASATITPSSPVFGDTLTCSWSAFIDADGDADWSEVSWEIDGVGAGTGPTLAGGFLGGQTVTCIVTPYDRFDYGAVVETSVEVGNTVPSIETVNITPDPAFAETALDCSWSGFTDVDEDADESTFEWTINGVAAGTTSPLVGGFVDGDEVTCTVTPADAEGTGTPVSASIEISNTAPSVATVNVSPESANYADTLTCSWTGFADADGDGDASTLEWQNGDGTVLGTESSLSGAFVGGDSVICVVTPFDGKDEGTPVSSEPIVIDNAPPVLTDVSLTPVEPTVSDELTCAPGVTTDPDGSTSFSYTYRWLVASVTVPGATGSTLSGSEFSRGQSVQCFATPSDGTDTGDEVGSNIIEVQNSRPQVDSLTLSPLVADTNTVITATVTLSDADGDSVIAYFEWLVNGVVVLEGESVDAFNGSVYFDKHDEVSVRVTPNDYSDDGPFVSSESIEINNTAPLAPTVGILPETPEPGEDLVCTILVDGTDIDEDLLSYTFEWYLDGVSTGFVSDTIAGSTTIHDQHWECIATSNDGEVSGGSDADSIVVNDMTNPDPPVFDDLAEHTNETALTLEGDCEPACTIDIYCDDVDGTAVYTSVCDPLGRFTDDISLVRGDIASCVATCTDIADNVSGPSTPHEVESCDPFDIYEDAETYGDSAADVIDEWATLSDDGGSFISIQGNVLDEDDDDWYVISTSDDLSADIAAGIDYFNFHVELVSGDDDFAFVVHQGGTGASELECPSLEGYTEYNWFVEDAGDSIDGVPSDTRSCSGTTVYGLNDCEDNSTEFYIHVYRVGGTEVTCENYELQISNGVW